MFYIIKILILDVYFYKILIKIDSRDVLMNKLSFIKNLYA